MSPHFCRCCGRPHLELGSLAYRGRFLLRVVGGPLIYLLELKEYILVEWYPDELTEHIEEAFYPGLSDSGSFRMWL